MPRPDILAEANCVRAAGSCHVTVWFGLAVRPNIFDGTVTDANTTVFTHDAARRRAALLTILQTPNVVPETIHIRFGWDNDDGRDRPLITTYDISTPAGTMPCFHEFTDT